MAKNFRFVREDGFDGFKEIDFSKGSGYVIAEPEGIDMLTADIDQTVGIDRIGTIANSVSIQPRIVTISGIIRGRGADARNKLLLVMPAGVKGKLYASSGGFTYYIDCYITQSAKIEGVPVNPRFSLQLLAPYPYWLSNNPQYLYDIPQYPFSRLYYKFSAYISHRIPFEFSFSVLQANCDNIVFAAMYTGMDSLAYDDLLEIRFGASLPEGQYTVVVDKSGVAVFSGVGSAKVPYTGNYWITPRSTLFALSQKYRAISAASLINMSWTKVSNATLSWRSEMEAIY